MSVPDEADSLRATVERLRQALQDLCVVVGKYGYTGGSLQRAKAALAAVPKGEMDLIAHLRRQRLFSEHAFGPGPRTAGVVAHIRKELIEIEAKPADLSEWIDVVILGFDGAWRAGYSPEEIAAALVAKQTKNEGRRWPDWRTMAPDQAIEHVRSADPEEGRDTLG